MKKNIKYILLFVIVLAIVVKILQVFVAGDKASDTIEPTEYKLSTEDASIFSEKYRNEIIIDGVYKNKGRNPISVVELAKQYRILITKVDLVDDLPLDSVLNIKEENNDITTFNYYRLISISSTYEFKINSIPHVPVSKIFMSVKGDLLQAKKTDSTQLITANTTNLSFRYGKNSATDLYINRKEDAFDGTLKPMNILFLKQNKRIYMLVLSPIKLKDSIPPNLLEELIRK